MTLLFEILTVLREFVFLFGILAIFALASKDTVRVSSDQTTGAAVVEWNKRLYRLVPLEGEK